MSTLPKDPSGVNPPSRFKAVSMDDPKLFIAPSFMDDLEYTHPFDLLTACDKEINRKTESGLEEWRPDNLKQTEMYRVSNAILSNVERLISGSSYSEEQALSALIRHSFERQNYHCRLKRWWIAIREGVINRDQQFERSQHFSIIYKYVSEHKMNLPNFGTGTRHKKFRIPEDLLGRTGKTAKMLGYSGSEYSHSLIMRSLSECERVEYKDEMRAAVIESHRALEQRIRIIVAHFQALRIVPCEKLKAALADLDLNDYQGWESMECVH